MAANLATTLAAHKRLLALTSPRAGFYIGLVKWRNQLLALLCLLVFLGFGVFYFRYWVVQKPFGIILFVGEGLAPGRLAMTRIYAGGADKPLRMDSLTYSALLRNYSNDSCIPDNAAAATALATGVKVNNGAVGIDAEGKSLENLIELARASGRMTGIVTNGRLTSPTVASFYAHTSSKSDRQSLARDLIEKGKVDLILGGGSEDFRPKSQGGKRADERDLFAEMLGAGYDVVQTRDELDEIPRWRQAKLFGVFGEEELPFASGDDEESNRPNLADMVRRGIELLQFNSGGYLLVVDAALMRKAVEDNDAERALSETVELDRAVSVALEYAGTNSTLIVCGDVALGGLIFHGAAPRNISGPGLFEPDAAGQPRLTWGITSKETKPAEEPNEQTQPEPTPSPGVENSPIPATESQQAGPASTMSPQTTGDDVVAFGNGLGTDVLRGSLESTTIFDIIRDNL